MDRLKNYLPVHLHQINRIVAFLTITSTEYIIYEKMANTDIIDGNSVEYTVADRKGAELTICRKPVYGRRLIGQFGIIG